MGADWPRRVTSRGASRSRAGGSGTVLVENVHSLFVARVHDGGIAEVYDPSGERARLCDEMEIVARAAKLREGGGRM